MVDIDVGVVRHSAALSQIEIDTFGPYFLGWCGQLGSTSTSIMSSSSRSTSITSTESRGGRMDCSSRRMRMSSISLLPTVDLSPFSCVTDIGMNFLCHCTALRYLDLPPLQHVHKITRRFLYGVQQPGTY